MLGPPQSCLPWSSAAPPGGAAWARHQAQTWLAQPCWDKGTPVAGVTGTVGGSEGREEPELQEKPGFPRCHAGAPHSFIKAACLLCTPTVRDGRCYKCWTIRSSQSSSPSRGHILVRKKGSAEQDQARQCHTGKCGSRKSCFQETQGLRGSPAAIRGCQ